MEGDPEKDTYSVLSKASYDYYYNGLENAQKELGTYSQSKGYTIIPKLSGKNAVVLKNGKKVVISYRGTDLLNPGDIFADAEILLGRDKVKLFLNDRFDSANQLYEKVKQEYPESDITLTGHSLGSAQAIYVGTKNNIKSVSFNEGTSPMDVVLSQISGADKKQAVYITAKDVISNLSVLEPYDIRFVPAKNDLNFFSHSLNYFLPKKSSPIPKYLQPVYQPSYKPKKVSSYADLTNQYGIDYFKEIARRYTR